MKNILSFDNFLYESKNYQTLYHIVDDIKLNYILNTNTITSKNFHNISLTRNKMMNGYLGESGFSIFKLELDSNKLSENYKISPFSYKSKNGEYFNEYEESVKTNIIKNASKYINKIILIKSKIEKLKRNLRDKHTVSNLFSIHKKNNIPNIIRDIKNKCLEKGLELYVQDGSIIKKDDDYIDSIINYKLVQFKYKYASVLRGKLYFRQEGEKYGYYIETCFDENDNKLEKIYMGEEFIPEDFPLKLYDDINDIPKLKEKTIQDEIFTPFILKILIKTDNIFRVIDLLPYENKESLKF